jgi:hypothetical protein
LEEGAERVLVDLNDVRIGGDLVLLEEQALGAF